MGEVHYFREKSMSLLAHSQQFFIARPNNCARDRLRQAGIHLQILDITGEQLEGATISCKLAKKIFRLCAKEGTICSGQNHAFDLYTLQTGDWEKIDPNRIALILGVAMPPRQKFTPLIMSPVGALLQEALRAERSRSVPVIG
jgi:hypothetical protein